MPKNFLLVSPFCRSNEHLTFESGIIELVSMTYPDAKIIFLGEKNHVIALKKTINVKNINFRHFNFRHRIFFGLNLVLQAFLLKRRTPNSLTLFLSFEHPHIVFLISILFKKSIWFLHTYWSNNILLKFIKIIGYKFFISRNYSIVLGRWIHYNMPTYMNNFWMYHPVINLRTEHNSKKLNQVILFPSRKYRAVNNIFLDTLVTNLRKISINAVLLPENRDLSMHKYASLLSESLFILFLSANGDYDLRCSGSLFDAISSGTYLYWNSSQMTQSLKKDFWDFWFFSNNPDFVLKHIKKCNRKYPTIHLSNEVFKKNRLLFSKIIKIIYE